MQLGLEVSLLWRYCQHQAVHTYDQSSGEKLGLEKLPPPLFSPIQQRTLVDVQLIWTAGNYQKDVLKQGFFGSGISYLQLSEVAHIW